MNPSRRTLFLSGGLIVFAACAAYFNSFAGPFVYDDVPSIADNPTIRHLGSWREVLNPPGEGRTVSARPMLNLSLAVNHAISGTAAWSYHALNLAIHALAALALFGLMRRTLLRPVLRERFGAASLPLALGVALLWVVHPLQTESVTYVIQRAESLMGLFYLLTLYFFVRAVEAPRPRLWWVGAMIACLLGMATKEVMVSAPLMALLYDRTFVAGTFREAWRRRWRRHAGLGATWILLASLVASAGGNRGGSVGYGIGIGWSDYWQTQFQAVAHYVRLSFWPHPLTFEYGVLWVKHAAEIVPYLVVVGPLIVGTLVALWRWPVAGFAGAWFWAILAPTCLMPGGMQMIVEHRMYLPLAGVIALAVAGLHPVLGRWSLAACCLMAVALAVVTARRNEDYRSVIAIWSDTVAKRPANVVARTSLANALIGAGRLEEGIVQFEAAVPLRANFPELHNNLGHALVRVGRLADARLHFEEAVRLQPGNVAAHDNLGNAYLQAGRSAEALAEYEKALRIKPGYAAAHMNLGNALRQLGRVNEAIEHFEAALRSDPDLPAIHYNYGLALNVAGRLPEAVDQLEQARRKDPASAPAENSLGTSLARLGRLPEAVACFERSLQLNANSVEARFNLATALLQLGRTKEATAQLENAARIAPDFAPVQEMLSRVREMDRRQR